MDADLILRDAYTLIAEQWCSPPNGEEDREQVRKDAESVVDRVRGVAEEGAALLAKFLAESSLSEEDYVDLFELAPKCALYLGSHTYDEPHTCANAAVSDRNGYMIELGGIYRHFGHVTVGRELPDYLPLMVDFLALTIESKDDTIRGKFIAEYFLPFVPPLRSRLEALKTPYLHLLEALESIITVDLKTQVLSKEPVQPTQPIKWEKTYDTV